ncbi:serine carboxypeptidase-like 50 [Artemisia annua]|uniref:Serine carboxypeptidase-like 50 n=1 Tax=Artemisia annua TaxID=35608 RepID=A0A2U1QDX0_ARTAN|nr:serine carboxypeptidase-like 50 [Artemisia annua]
MVGLTHHCESHFGTFARFLFLGILSLASIGGLSVFLVLVVDTLLPPRLSESRRSKGVRGLEAILQVPLLIWLQGGPGCSSLTGNFFELGPYLVMSSLKHNVEHLTLKKNPSSWNRLFDLLFLDNPIGTGFSIASTYEEIPRNRNIPVSEWVNLCGLAIGNGLTAPVTQVKAHAKTST